MFVNTFFSSVSTKTVGPNFKDRMVWGTGGVTSLITYGPVRENLSSSVITLQWFVFPSQALFEQKSVELSFLLYFVDKFFLENVYLALLQHFIDWIIKTSSHNFCKLRQLWEALPPFFQMIPPRSYLCDGLGAQKATFFSLQQPIAGISLYWTQFGRLAGQTLWKTCQTFILSSFISAAKPKSGTWELL